MLTKAIRLQRWLYEANPRYPKSYLAKVLINRAGLTRQLLIYLPPTKVLRRPVLVGGFLGQANASFLFLLI
jgi:hypothetical protein